MPDADDLMLFLRKFAELAPELSQLLNGWSQDGTAWSEWDESVRQRFLSLQRDAETEIAKRESP